MHKLLAYRESCMKEDRLRERAGKLEAELVTLRLAYEQQNRELIATKMDYSDEIASKEAELAWWKACYEVTAEDVQTIQEAWDEVRDNLAKEKENRIYYQDIVYHVSSKLDRGVPGATAVDNVKDEIDKFMIDYGKIEAEKTVLRGALVRSKEENKNIHANLEGVRVDRDRLEDEVIQIGDARNSVERNLLCKVRDLREENDKLQTEWNPGWMNEVNVKKIEQLWGLLAELLEAYEDQFPMDYDDSLTKTVRDTLAGKK